MDSTTYVKNIGIEGIQRPENICNDEKCPWHGNVRIRGFTFEGEVKRINHNIALVEFKRYYYVPKYERYEIRISRIKAHIPGCLNIKIGDNVLIGETRPLSKTIRFVVINKK
ncbi:30S ribosomal protein S17 [Nanobdella aerobiophila]|uniref:30S ribosomal protein S17 n=1 Tax=Nanobdella aerobiophila TaxID=2586965 RepID=A0A915WSC6_9ARCH|nr:30S ribosomal protein S17 [Nanobdella aerobiophila]BBL45806.1 30S ribosomal protein S17 [Nanobdella aerobiophila]